MMSDYHEWGDEDFDWEGLNNAGQYIQYYCAKYGRIGIHQKEKYGTLRADTYFSGTVHDLIWPGHYYTHYAHDALRKLDYDFSYYSRWLFKLINVYQRFIYRLVYKRAVKKWPHLIEEILVDADHPDLLKGLGYDFSQCSEYNTVFDVEDAIKFNEDSTKKNDKVLEELSKK
jgi:hypothetical protein